MSKGSGFLSLRAATCEPFVDVVPSRRCVGTRVVCLVWLLRPLWYTTTLAGAQEVSCQNVPDLLDPYGPDWVDG